MIIENLVQTKVPLVPVTLRNKVHFITAFRLEETELTSISLALKLIACEIEKKGIEAEQLISVYILLTEDGSFTATFDNEHDTLGAQVNLIIFPIKKWRERNLDLKTMIQIALEELCHHFWGIEDEVIVKLKVTELMRYYYPNCTVTDLYDLGEVQ